MNRTCATRLPFPGDVRCGHREESEHAPAVRGAPAAPRPCRVPGCACREFTPPGPAEPLDTSRSSPREVR